MKSLKVLLIAPTYVDNPNTMYFPIGMAYLASYIRSRGHTVHGFNMNNVGRVEGEKYLRDLLSRERYDVIGLGALTIAFEQLEKLIRFLRPLSDAAIVLGGGITACESEIVLTELQPDYMVISEGEVIFEQLLDYIANPSGTPLPKGVWTRTPEGIISGNEGDTIPNLDDLPFPDYELMGIGQFIELQTGQTWSHHKTDPFTGKYIPISASRSCPFKCTFCYHAGMGKYRLHSIPYTIAFIKKMKEAYGVTHFSIYDELFSASISRVLEFCEAAKQLNITFVCQLRVDQVSAPMLRAMKEAGCTEISYGFESASDTVIESMQKKIFAHQIAEAVRLTREAKIGIQGNFLFGDPAETKETLQTTLDFQQQHRLYFADWSMVLPYPGTVLHAQALRKGMIRDRVRFIKDIADTSRYLWNSPVNLTVMSDEEYLQVYAQLRELNDINHRQALSRVVASRSLDGFHSAITVECPHCQTSTSYERFPYPLDARTEVSEDRSSFYGLLGINLICPECRDKHHLLSKAIPHVTPVFERFDAVLSELVRSHGDEIVVLPAMDRYFHALCEDTAILSVRPFAVLDTREHRIGKTFLDTTVQKFDDETVDSLADKRFLILPWVEAAEVYRRLIARGIPEERIVSWNFPADRK